MFSYMPLKVYLLVSSAMKNKTECFIACYFILLANHTCNLFFSLWEYGIAGSLHIEGTC